MSQEEETAHENPMIAMVDEETSEKYARAVGHKGMGGGHDMDWLIKDLSDELKAWGHPGPTGGELILKCDSEFPARAVREALAKYHGGRMIPMGPPKGESQSNGVVQGAGKTREFVRAYKDQVEEERGD